MIVLAVHFNQRRLKVGTDLGEDGTKSVDSISVKDPISILCDEDQMDMKLNVLKEEGQLAWATRKDTEKYGAEYDFDYLMLVAQGYEESDLDQSLRNPSGALGIMQVNPQHAAAPPINIPHVEIAENNIHAGAKMMRSIADNYFNDAKLDPLNKTLMTFASYNAGPSGIADLRRKAASEGLDPHQWFGNVELIVARQVGQQTVQYVSNVYKYYVAYKLTLEESRTIK